jgi:Delta24-sterol reductase
MKYFRHVNVLFFVCTRIYTFIKLMQQQRQHDRRVEAVVARVRARPATRRLCTSRGGGGGHCVRGAVFKEGAWVVDVAALRHVLAVDREGLTCRVEPGVTMEALCHALLGRHGCLPRVVPEFRSITVGGAIMGLGLESSSFRYGMFEDSVLGMRMVLGDGRLVEATPDNQHADLFFATFGSYASLGILVAVELKMVRASARVRVRYERISTLEAALGAVLCHPSGEDQVDFCEGVIFDKVRASRVTAAFVHDDDESVNDVDGKGTIANSRNSNKVGWCGALWAFVSTVWNACRTVDLQHWRYSWGVWFFEYIDSRNADDWSEIVPTLDYLFRWDRGAYWCAKLSERVPSSLCGRVMFGWYFSAQRAYAIEHTSKTNNDFHRLVQDCCVPEGSRLRRFLDFVDTSLGIYPLWLCPVRGDVSGARNAKRKLFSLPIGVDGDGSGGGIGGVYFMNVGIYGIPKAFHGQPWHLSYIEGNRALHEVTVRMRGARAYYSTSYCTEEEFWRDHDRDAYARLRQEYGAESTVVDIFTKIVSKFPPPRVQEAEEKKKML